MKIHQEGELYNIVKVRMQYSGMIKIIRICNVETQDIFPSPQMLLEKDT